MGRGARRIVTTCALAGALFVSMPANASPSAKLVYVRGAGAESCPAEGEVRKAVAVRIGYDPFFAVAQKTVVAQVQHVANGYRGKVQIVGDDGILRGERDLSTTGDDCRELVGALALAVSIALDDLDEPAPMEPQAATPTNVEREPVAPAPPHDALIVPLPVTRAPPAREATPAELAISVGPTIAIGTAPNVAEGASVAAALRWPSAAIRLDVRGELPSSAEMPRGGRVATNLVLATASGCLRGRVPFACVGIGSGVLFSETKNITRENSDHGALLASSARAGVDIGLTYGLYLEPFAEVGVNILTPRVAVDGAVVHQTSPVWGFVGLHFGGRLLL